MTNYPVFFNDGGDIVNSKARDILGCVYTVAVRGDEAFEYFTTYYMNTDKILYPGIWTKSYDDNGYPIWEDLAKLAEEDELVHRLYLYILDKLAVQEK